MSGFDNDVMYAKNADFTAADNQSVSESNGLITNGALWIGSNSVNSGGTHINVGVLSSPDGSITFGYSSPNITAQVSATGDKHVAKFIVSSQTGVGGQYTTINSAYAAAVSTGLAATIFIMPGLTGTYTEDLILTTPLINITAFTGDGITPTVTLIGKISCSFAGSATISGIRLQTNSDYIVSVTGNSATILELRNCYLNGTNHNLTQYTSSSGSSRIRFFACEGDKTTTGIADYDMSSAGTMTFHYCNIRNSGASTTASTFSGTATGAVNFFHCNAAGVYQTNNSNATFRSEFTEFNNDALNTTPIDMQAGAGRIYNSFLRGGTAPALNSETTNVQLDNVHITSTNTNPVSGAGAVKINYVGVEGTAGAFVTAPTGNNDFLGKIHSTEITNANGVVVYNGTNLVNYAQPQVSSAGVATNTSQPCFSAYCSANSSNATGGNVQFKIPFDSTLVNQGTGFNTTTYTYTVPVTGTYQFNFKLSISGGDVTSTQLLSWASINSAAYPGFRLISASPAVTLVAVTEASYAVSWQYYHTAGDTISMYVDVLNGSQNVNVNGTLIDGCLFSGYLIC